MLSKSCKARTQTLSGNEKLTESTYPVKTFKILDRLHFLIADQVSIANPSATQYLHGCVFPSVEYLEIHNVVEYHCFCDDFGPMNLGMVFRFCQLVNARLDQCSPLCSIVLVSETDPKKLTNSTFLLGAYLIMCHAQSPNDVVRSMCEP